MVGAVDFNIHTWKGTFVHKLKLPHCSVLDKPLCFYYMWKIRRREEGKNSNALKNYICYCSGAKARGKQPGSLLQITASWMYLIQPSGYTGKLRFGSCRKPSLLLARKWWRLPLSIKAAVAEESCKAPKIGEPGSCPFQRQLRPVLLTEVFWADGRSPALMCWNLGFALLPCLRSATQSPFSSCKASLDWNGASASKCHRRDVGCGSPPHLATSSRLSFHAVLSRSCLKVGQFKTGSPEIILRYGELNSATSTFRNDGEGGDTVAARIGSEALI